MRRIAAAGLLAFAVACSSATTSGGPRTGSNRNVITYEEIQASRQAGWTAWDLISTLRPLYLKSRGMTSLGNPAAGVSTIAAIAVVYVDGARYGDLQSLKGLSVENIRRIEYMSASDATTRYGTDHNGGVILISTR